MICTFVSASDLSMAKGEKMYTKEFYSNGTIKAEGWKMASVKTGYWKFYYSNGELASKGHFRKDKRNSYWHFYNENGQLSKEGHYVDGSAENWWIFHDIANSRTNKYQYKNNQKHGFCLIYKKRKLILAEKYSHDKKEGEWSSIIDFKRDNPGVYFY
jgi:hypothetical protein